MCACVIHLLYRKRNKREDKGAIHIPRSRRVTPQRPLLNSLQAFRRARPQGTKKAEVVAPVTVQARNAAQAPPSTMTPAPAAPLLSSTQLHTTMDARSGGGAGSGRSVEIAAVVVDAAFGTPLLLGTIAELLPSFD